MSFRLATVLFVAMLAICTEAELPARTLLQGSGCGRACSAARRTDPNTIQAVINEGNNICNCICTRAAWSPMHLSVLSRCSECIRVCTTFNPLNASSVCSAYDLTTFELPSRQYSANRK